MQIFLISEISNMEKPKWFNIFAPRPLEILRRLCIVAARSPNNFETVATSVAYLGFHFAGGGGGGVQVIFLNSVGICMSRVAKPRVC